MWQTSRSAMVLLIGMIGLATAADIIFDGGFNRDDCYARTLAALGNGSLAMDDEVFARDNSGYPLASKENVTLTLPGCRQICGPKQMFYWDIGPRLSTWLIPILLLLSNVELSPLDKRRFMAIIHLLGDPIDSLWSLVHKIDAWQRCYDLAGQYSPVCSRRRRIISTVFAGFEEIEGPHVRSSQYFDRIMKHSDVNDEEIFRKWRRAASELADGRTDEFFRTCLAILLYIYQVIAGFVAEVGGGNTSPPGGRIGTAMFISWLVPAVLLSNTIGGFTSRRSCFDIMNRFAERALSLGDMPSSEHSMLFESIHSDPNMAMEYFKTLSWSGAIYVFRPWKTRYISENGSSSVLDYWRRTATVFMVSILPLYIGMTGAFIIIWYTLPNGLNCRHFWVIGIFLAWHVSAFITWITRFKYSGGFHWHLILIKDAIIGISSVLVIFLSACGIFNSCFCWSGFYTYHDKAHVPLNSTPFYVHNDRTIYPIVVAICLFLQCTVFAFIAWMWWDGLKVMRWSEWAKRDEWERGRGLEGERVNDCCICKLENHLSFIQRLLHKAGLQKTRQTEHTCCPCKLEKHRRASKAGQLGLRGDPIRRAEKSVPDEVVFQVELG